MGLFGSSLSVVLHRKLAPLPRGTDEIVEQATKACLRAWADGVSRQSVELLLPLIGATDLDDWYAMPSSAFLAGSKFSIEPLSQSQRQWTDSLHGNLG